MIAKLRGEISEVDDEGLTLDVGGVGYEVFCTGSVLDRAEVGKAREFWIHTHVREDALTLFGFESPWEKKLFLSLLKVNGVGPKMGMKVLSGAPPEHIRDMIENGDVKGLSQLPKVGKKTAEQIILTLKGKLEFVEGAERTGTAVRGNREEILSALVHLGFKAAEVEKVVAQMPPDVDVQDGIRQGLGQLAQI